MRIAFMAYDSPNYFGGPITNARRLLPELQRRGHEVHALIFFHQQSPASYYLESQGVRCHTILRPRFTEQQITWILKTIQKIKPDIFIPNIFVSGWYAAKWVRQAGIPSIAAHRNDDAYHWGMVEEFVAGSREWAIDGLVCVSHSIKQQAQKQVLHHTQLCMIPSGVPVPQTVSHQDHPLKLVYVGRLVQPQKRIWDTLEACIHVSKMFPDVSITFIGDGTERLALEQQVEDLNLTANIHFLGAIPTECLHQELVNHHVVILLSDYEGTPGAIMDGMACGLIPVCTHIPGGTNELVFHERTGLLVQNRADSFYEAIRRLYQDLSFRHILSVNARTYIEQEYSLKIAANRWEAFFFKLHEVSTFKQTILIPKIYNLPQVNPKLADEDIRLPKNKFKQQFIRAKFFLKQKLNNINFF